MAEPSDSNLDRTLDAPAASSEPSGSNPDQTLDAASPPTKPSGANHNETLDLPVAGAPPGDPGFGETLDAPAAPPVLPRPGRTEPMSDASAPLAQAPPATVDTEVASAAGGFAGPRADFSLGRMGTLDARQRGPGIAPRTRDLEDYEILGELGRGGMGVVYKARQVSLERVVALKMILGGAHAGPAQVIRFRAEAEAVARLQHPNVVQVFEVGEQDGLRYIALEFVDGGSLEQQTHGEPQPAAKAAATVETLARAMHHCHQQGVVHRDLKPANILLTPDGQPKITDFGLAKFLDGEGGPTRTGAAAGTPSYMAPEQASGKAKEAGPPTDVYALGAILYDLLTGRPPFHADTAMDTMQQVVSQEPVPPRQLSGKVPRDLETICLKCLQKEPAKRYASALDLAEDLARFQRGEAITARPTGAAEKAWKWARRRPALAGLLAVSAAAVVALLAGGWWWSAELKAHNTELTEEQARTEEQRQVAVHEQKQAEDAGRLAEQRRRESEARELQTRRYWYVADMNLAQQAWDQAFVARAVALLDRHRPGPGQLDLRGFDWYYLWRLCHSERAVLRGHTGPVPGLAFVPGSPNLVSASPDRTVRLWRTDRAGPSRVLFSEQELLGNAVAVEPAGKVLAVGTADGHIIVSALPSGARLVSFGDNQGPVTALVYGSGGNTLASAGMDTTVKFWDMTGNRPRLLKTLTGHKAKVNGLAFSRDGRLLASAGTDKTLRLWEVPGGRLRHTLTGHTLGVTSVAFAPDGKTLASGGMDGTVRLWDPVTGRETATLSGHGDHVWSVAFRPDGAVLASASGDNTVKLWDPAQGRELATLKGHGEAVWSVAFAPDGGLLAAGGVDGTIRLWGAVHWPEPLPWPAHKQTVTAVAPSPNGRLLATSSFDGTVQLRDTGDFRLLRTLKGHQGAVWAVAFAPDGTSVATGGADKTVRLWDVGTGNEFATLRGQAREVSCVAFSPDGATLACGCFDGTVRLWDVATRRVRQDLHGHRFWLWALAFSPDGKLLASAGRDKKIHLWEVATGRERRTLEGHTDQVRALAFAPEGTLLASASEDRTVRLWPVEDAGPPQVLTGHTNLIRALAFAPDGRVVASAGWDSAVKLWDVATGQERMTLKDATNNPCCLAFVRGGEVLVAGGLDGTLKVWTAPRGGGEVPVRGSPAR